MILNKRTIISVIYLYGTFISSLKVPIYYNQRNSLTTNAKMQRNKLASPSIAFSLLRGHNAVDNHKEYFFRFLFPILFDDVALVIALIYVARKDITRNIPNFLTILRIIAVPAFVFLYLSNMVRIS